MRTALVLTVLVLLGCGKKTEETDVESRKEPVDVTTIGKEETPANAKLMPKGFEAFVIGAKKTDIVSKVPLKSSPIKPTEPPWKESAELLFKEELNDDLFQKVELAFKYDRLVGALFHVREDRCGKDIFYGTVKGLNSKLGCVGKVFGPGEFHAGIEIRPGSHLATYYNCLPESDADDTIDTYKLVWTQILDVCQVSLYIYSSKAWNWLPPTQEVEL